MLKHVGALKLVNEYYLIKSICWWITDCKKYDFVLPYVHDFNVRSLKNEALKPMLSNFV
jgi:hypothetical protein